MKFWLEVKQRTHVSFKNLFEEKASYKFKNVKILNSAKIQNHTFWKEFNPQNAFTTTFSGFKRKVSISEDTFRLYSYINQCTKIKSAIVFYFPHSLLFRIRFSILFFIVGNLNEGAFPPAEYLADAGGITFGGHAYASTSAADSLRQVTHSLCFKGG